MLPQKITDDEVLPAILRGGVDLDAAWYHIHKHWRSIWFKVILSAGGEPDDIDEAYAMACETVFKAAKKGGLAMNTASFRTYFVRCVLNAWLKLKENETRRANLIEKIKAIYPDDDLTLDSNDNGEQAQTEENEKKALVDKLLKQVTERCYKILLTYYFENKNMEFIQKIMGFESLITARKEKYKCMLSIHKFLETHPAFYHRLKELKRHG